VRLFPGVRLNITKNGVGLGFGGHGVRYSVHSTGRRTFSVGIPGTGLYWTESRNGRRPQSRRALSDPVDRETSQPADTHTAKPPLRSLEELRRLIAGSSVLSRTLGPAFSNFEAALDGDDKEVARAARALVDAAASAEASGSPMLGLQPMPGFELEVDLTGDGVVLFCACHLLSERRVKVAEELLQKMPHSDEVLLVRMAAKMHAGDPMGALTTGLPKLDSVAAWMAGLVRAKALRDCHRGDDADELMADLLECSTACNVPHEAQEVLHVLRGRRQLDVGNVAGACATAAQVLSWDPYDQAALALLIAAQQALYRDSDTGDVEVRTREGDRQRLSVVVASLEAELRGAQQVLLELVEELDDVAARRRRVLGPRELRIADLKARLAALLAEMSGDSGDIETAQTCKEQREERQREWDAGEGFEAFSAEPPPANERTKASDPQDQEEVMRNKKLYLQLIKRWHPDHAVDEQDRRRRHDMTTRITQMYRDGDWEGLQHLWERGALDLDEAEQLPLHELEKKIQAVREELARTRAEIAELLASPLEQLRIELETADAEGQDLLAELAEALDAEIAELEQSIDELHAPPAAERI
jgi:hypothetical protein